MSTAKLFKNGRSQAVRLPKEFRFRGKEVFIRRFGAGVALMPTDDPWASLVESLNEFSADFLSHRAQPPVQRRKGL